MDSANRSADPASTGEVFLQGLPASAGICIGKAYLVHKGGVSVVKKYFIHESKLEAEKNRFRTAVKKAADELRHIIQETPEEFREHAEILKTHVMLLNDKMLYNKSIDTIEKDRVNAEWALRKVVSSLKPVFMNMSDTYFRERWYDIAHVSDRIMQNLSGETPVDIRNIDKRVILVARDLSPAETSQIHLERVKGFVTDLGGIASHTGIIARSLQIPAVLGLETATRTIKNDDLILVDGFTGQVIINPSEENLIRYEERKERFEIRIARMSRGAQTPAGTRDGVKIQVMGNIELPEEVVSVKDYGGDGIGLYRTEFQYLAGNRFPTEFELYDKYRDVVEVMAPDPVVIRTLDINGDKAVAYTLQSEEANPALGLRAIRYCLQKPEIFQTQLRAILRAAVHGNVRVLFPMISSYEEVLETKKLFDGAARALESEGIPFNREIEIGIMVEVPSVVILADIIAKEVDFFSIGTNDLIQYSMAIDRQNRQVAHLFDPLHPAILRMIKRVSDVAKEEGISLAMCGEMAGQPINIPILLGLGIEEMSMNPRSIPLVKQSIRTLSMGETKTFIGDALKQATAADVRRVLEEAYGCELSDKCYTE
jgi:phosphotransferase system enzyme I (PtsI)